jgi:hypothetical protein
MTDLLPMRRCCATHRDWTELIDHLTERFPQVQPGEVVEIVARSRQAAKDFDLPDHDHLDTAEMMARYQLLQISGTLPDNARLKPERHQRAQP